MDARLNAIHQWLRDDLHLTDYSIEPASADASFRRYFRVSIDGATRIIMDAPPAHEDCGPFIDICERLLQAGVNAPAIYAQNLEQGFLLLKDLGSTMYLDALNEENADTLYGDAIQSLVQIQTRSCKDDLPPYDHALLSREIALFTDWLMQTHLGLTPSPDLQNDFHFLIENALAQPQVFVHRDYHSRNLTISHTHNPGVIDFQDAVLGPITYDLVSLLRDCYVSWPAARVTQWRDTFTAKAVTVSLITADEAQQIPRWFDLMGAQRHLKASGIFARLYHRDGKSGYLKDIPRTLDYLLTVSQAYPELKNLETCLIQEVIPALQAKQTDNHINAPSQNEEARS